MTSLTTGFELNGSSKDNSDAKFGKCVILTDIKKPPGLLCRTKTFIPT